MTSEKIAILGSLWLTIPTILLAVRVVWEWWPNVSSRLVKLFKGDSSPSDRGWFVFGVFLGFLSMALDNTYWQYAWTTVFIHSPLADSAIGNGVYFNIPFRQCLGLLSAYCHLRAVAGVKEIAVSKVNQFTAYSFLAGAAYGATALILRLNG
ncbi:hypothetical protein [uncultured Paraglaciecola sp.]|uniref:hypothetical protein n=1 Tax=uncultured Paraglaciecola sp. TaxID=1765024 RepID=UPI0026229CB3|nr:hypothetical protein [uncultured Paraglaciecola sp.]